MLLALYVPAAHSQTNGIPPFIIQCSPDTPSAGSPLTITLLVEHSNPHEVTILAPSFPDSFFLDRVFKSARLMPGTDSRKIWTEAEYRIIPGSPGSYTIDPFVIIMPGGNFTTGSISVTVSGEVPAGAAHRLRLQWKNVPAELHVGQNVVIGLAVSGWNSDLPLPGPLVFLPPLDKSCIIEAAEQESPAGESDFVLGFTLIPVAAQTLYFPARTVAYNNFIFEIPELGIKVSPSPFEFLKIAVPEEQAPVPLFPEFDFPLSSGFFTRLFFRIGVFRADYETVYRTAEDLYNRMLYIEALALLRQNERDKTAFPLFASLRRRTEQNMGVYDTRNEKPEKFLFIVYQAFIALALIVLIVFYLRKTSRKSKVVLCVIFIAVSAGYLVFRLSETWAAGLPHAGPCKFALLKNTWLCQVPDYSAEQFNCFTLGQPVRVFRIAKENKNTEQLLPAEVSWVWIISYNKERLSGWIPEDQAVFY